jgi:hypothetical protein
MNTWRFPIHLFVPALFFCAANSASAATWSGGFLSKSGITWTYEVRTDNAKVSVSVSGDRQGTKFAATCADTALDAMGLLRRRANTQGAPLRSSFAGG